MNKPLLLLIHPAPDKERLGSRRRRKSSMAQLNLPLLAAHADDRFEVRIIDENIEDIDFDVNADLVGITVMTPMAYRAYQIADEFRERSIKVVMGGMHVFFMQDEAAPHADSLVIGEAEHVWNRLLDDLLAGKMKQRYQSDRPHDLENLPHPRIDLLKKEAYTFSNILETSRGCPHKCEYCSVTQYWGNRFRFRPIPEVIEEIRNMPPGEINFVDDNIYGHPKRAKELFQALIPLNRRWHAQGDLRLARDPELLKLAVRSGCKWLFVGIESIDPENLKAVGKQRVNLVEEYTQSIAKLQKSGINIFGSLIFGMDNDDQSVFERTVRFCVENRLEGANFYIYTPLPGTKLFEKTEKERRILHRDWSMYDMNHVVFRPKNMTPEELLEGYLYAYRSFYSFPSIVKRFFRPRRNLVQLMALNVGRRINYRYFEEGCRY